MWLRGFWKNNEIENEFSYKAQMTPKRGKKSPMEQRYKISRNPRRIKLWCPKSDLWRYWFGAWSCQFYHDQQGENIDDGVFYFFLSQRQGFFPWIIARKLSSKIYFPRKLGQKYSLTFSITHLLRIDWELSPSGSRHWILPRKLLFLVPSLTVCYLPLCFFSFYSGLFRFSPRSPKRRDEIT